MGIYCRRPSASPAGGRPPAGSTYEVQNMSLFEKMFGTFSSKELKKIKPIASKVLALEDEFAAKTDSELRAMTPALRARDLSTI